MGRVSGLRQRNWRVLLKVSTSCSYAHLHQLSCQPPPPPPPLSLPSLCSGLTDPVHNWDLVCLHARLRQVLSFNPCNGCLTPDPGLPPAPPRGGGGGVCVCVCVCVCGPGERGQIEASLGIPKAYLQLEQCTWCSKAVEICSLPGCLHIASFPSLLYACRLLSSLA